MNARNSGGAAPSLALVRCIHGHAGGGNLRDRFWVERGQLLWLHAKLCQQRDACGGGGKFRIVRTPDGLDVESAPGWGLAWLRETVRFAKVRLYEECVDCGARFRPGLLECSFRCSVCFRVRGWAPARAD